MLPRRLYSRDQRGTQLMHDWLDAFKPSVSWHTHLLLAALMWTSVGTAPFIVGTRRMWLSHVPFIVFAAALTTAAVLGLVKARFFLAAMMRQERAALEVVDSDSAVGPQVIRRLAEGASIVTRVAQADGGRRRPFGSVPLHPQPALIPGPGHNISRTHGVVGHKRHNHGWALDLQPWDLALQPSRRRVGGSTV